MSMGYAAAYADTIEESSIEKFCKKEIEIFRACVNGCELDMEEFARNAEFNDFEDYDKDLLKAYENLCEAFEKKTGLSLGLAFHDADDDGDRYDDVNGIYWYVEGMYQLNPEGKKMKKHVKRQTFVQFG